MNIEDDLSALFSGIAIPRGCVGLRPQHGWGSRAGCAADEGGLWRTANLSALSPWLPRDAEPAAGNAACAAAR